MQKGRKCSKGFPCGKTCINRQRQCWANLSTDENRLAENFSQFVNRLVGIGNDKESSLGTDNPSKEVESPKDVDILQVLTPEGLNYFRERIKEDEDGYNSEEINNEIRDIIKRKTPGLEPLNKEIDDLSKQVEDIENQLPDVKDLILRTHFLADDLFWPDIKDKEFKPSDLFTTKQLEEIADQYKTPYRNNLVVPNMINDNEYLRNVLERAGFKIPRLADIKDQDYELEIPPIPPQEVLDELDREYNEIKSQRSSALDPLKERLSKLKKDRQYALNNVDNSDFVQYNREGSISDNIKSRELPEGDNSNESERVLQEYINERAPMMATHANILSEILNSPNKDFKNTYELKAQMAGIAGGMCKSEFNKYLKARKETEFEAFNIPVTARANKRPVYGFLGNETDLNDRLLTEDGRGSVGSYGNVIIRFKPEIKDDITVTIDDSLGGGLSYTNEMRQKGSPANKVSIESMPNKGNNLVNPNYNDLTDLIDPQDKRHYRAPRYIEWQSGGKLDLSMVDMIYIPVNEYLKLSQSDLNQIEDLGINIKVLQPRD